MVYANNGGDYIAVVNCINMPKDQGCVLYNTSGNDLPQWVGYSKFSDHNNRVWAIINSQPLSLRFAIVLVLQRVLMALFLQHLTFCIISRLTCIVLHM